MAKKILILHDAGEAGAAAPLAAGLEAHGADVSLRPCVAPYDAVLDAIAEADEVLFWR
jgi:hypothetical protein